MYKQTNTENIFYNETDLFDYNIIYAFMMYDKEFHWSLSSKKMALLNKNMSKEIIIVGPLWNSLIVKNDKLSDSVSKKFNKERFFKRYYYYAS